MRRREGADLAIELIFPTQMNTDDGMEKRGWVRMLVHRAEKKGMDKVTSLAIEQVEQPRLVQYPVPAQYIPELMIFPLL